MSESVVSTPSQTLDVDSVGKAIYHVMIQPVTGTITLPATTTPVLVTHTIGFKPSFWLMEYKSTYTNNSSMLILTYDTDDHEFYYSGGQTSGTDYYAALDGSTVYLKAMYWRSNGVSPGTYGVSATCKAVFFK